MAMGKGKTYVVHAADKDGKPHYFIWEPNMIVSDSSAKVAVEKMLREKGRNWDLVAVVVPEKV